MLALHFRRSYALLVKQEIIRGMGSDRVSS